MDRELAEINSFNVFSDGGVKTYETTDLLRRDGYKQIRLHWGFNAKLYGRRKGRLVANGALTSADISGTYSIVVSLRRLRMC